MASQEANNEVTVGGSGYRLPDNTTMQHAIRLSIVEITVTG